MIFIHCVCVCTPSALRPTWLTRQHKIELVCKCIHYPQWNAEYSTLPTLHYPQNTSDFHLWWKILLCLQSNTQQRRSLQMLEEVMQTWLAQQMGRKPQGVSTTSQDPPGTKCCHSGRASGSSSPKVPAVSDTAPHLQKGTWKIPIMTLTQLCTYENLGRETANCFLLCWKNHLDKSWKIWLHDDFEAKGRLASFVTTFQTYFIILHVISHLYQHTFVIILHFFLQKISNLPTSGPIIDKLVARPWSHHQAPKSWNAWTLAHPTPWKQRLDSTDSCTQNHKHRTSLCFDSKVCGGFGAYKSCRKDLLAETREIAFYIYIYICIIAYSNSSERMIILKISSPHAR